MSVAKTGTSFVGHFTSAIVGTDGRVVREEIGPLTIIGKRIVAAPPATSADPTD